MLDATIDLNPISELIESDEQVWFTTKPSPPRFKINKPFKAIILLIVGGILILFSFFLIEFSGFLHSKLNIDYDEMFEWAISLENFISQFLALLIFLSFLQGLIFCIRSIIVLFFSSEENYYVITNKKILTIEKNKEKDCKKVHFPKINSIEVTFGFFKEKKSVGTIVFKGSSIKQTSTDISQSSGINYFEELARFKDIKEPFKFVNELIKKIREERNTTFEGGEFKMNIDSSRIYREIDIFDDEKDLLQLKTYLEPNEMIWFTTKPNSYYFYIQKTYYKSLIFLFYGIFFYVFGGLLLFFPLITILLLSLIFAPHLTKGTLYSITDKKIISKERLFYTTKYTFIPFETIDTIKVTTNFLELMFYLGTIVLKGKSNNNDYTKELARFPVQKQPNELRDKLLVLIGKDQKTTTDDKTTIY